MPCCFVVRPTKCSEQEFRWSKSANPAKTFVKLHRRYKLFNYCSITALLASWNEEKTREIVAVKPEMILQLTVDRVRKSDDTQHDNFNTRERLTGRV